MSTGIIITSIICGTLIILTIINKVSEVKKREASKTLFDDIFKSKGGK